MSSTGPDIPDGRQPASATQQLACEAVQEIRIKHRWQAIDEENEQIALAKKQGITYVPLLLPNGDSPKQLLARSRYLLFKHKEHWTYSQKQRAELMFERYPARGVRDINFFLFRLQKIYA